MAASRTPRIPPPTPDPELASRLRLAVTRTARRLRQESAGDGPQLSPTLTAALATIDRCGPLTPSALAEAERIQRPTATRIVARLEQDGLVSRASDPSDGRVSLVEITREGRALLKRIRSRKNEFLAKRLRALTPQEQATLAAAAELLERLLEQPATASRQDAPAPAPAAAP
jgi:DNA-binding MarR family transcriptional regulator